MKHFNLTKLNKWVTQLFRFEPFFYQIEKFIIFRQNLDYSKSLKKIALQQRGGTHGTYLVFGYKQRRQVMFSHFGYRSVMLYSKTHISN